MDRPLTSLYKKCQRYINLRSRFLNFFLIVLICLTFLLLGIDAVNNASKPDWGDTPHYLEGALFVKEHGGISKFLNLCLSGQYKIEMYRPLYLLALSPFASRDIPFFSKAKYTSLAIGFIVLISSFLIARRLFEWHVAFVAATLLVFNVTFLEESSHVDVETLLILFILLSWYFMAKGADNNKYWVLAGVSGGLAYMTKGSGILTIPVFVISNLLFFRLKIIKNKYFWLFFLFFLIACSPLIIRNIVLHHNPIYQGVDSSLFWLDSYGDLGRTGFFINWREHTFDVGNVPTMFSYFKTHSASEFINRLIEGIKGESGVIIENMNMLIIPRGKTYVSLLLAPLFFLGIIKDKDNLRKTYAIMTALAFFLSCAWYFDIVAYLRHRFIAPLIPLVCIYSSLGCIELVKYIDKKLLAKHESFKLFSAIPFVLTIFFVLSAMYFTETKDIYPSLYPRSADIRTEDYELMGWMKKNIKGNDIVIFGPSLVHWGLLYLTSFKGTLVPFFPLAKNFSEFEGFLHNRNINYLILHKESYSKIENVIKDYITYDDVNGLVQKRPINGWKLIYGYSEKPTKFLIYQIYRNNS